MIGNHQPKKFDLEERTLKFAKNVVDLVKSLPKNSINIELISQIIRSAGSVGANYREANESLSKKDFCMRVKISRKEAKETIYWLELIQHTNPHFSSYIEPLFDESYQLLKIFSSIINKSS